MPAPGFGREERTRRSQSAETALYGIYEISKLLTIPARLEKTLAGVLGLLSSFLDMRHGLIALLADDGAPETVVGANFTEETARRYFDQLPEQVIGRIVVTQMPLIIESVREDPLFEGTQFVHWSDDGGDVSFIGVPIKDRGKVIGTLTIDREHATGDQVAYCFDDDVRFLTMIANLLGQTLRLQRFMVRDRERLLEEQRRLEKALTMRSAGGVARPESAGPREPRPAGIVGESPAIRAVLEKVRIVARSQSTVLLRGESGTGKELFARALHELSTRRDKPFVTLNCAALPESVLESELFGHEKGSFTGAQAQRKGRFELAHEGTLFLDEIGEISATFQAKLLRVLQIGEFERVGGTSTLKVDVRVVAATNRNLEEAVARGEFRADLYYRISVVPILLPALRDRPTDIPLLAREFLGRFNEENGTSLELNESGISVLVSCCFPGNVRELENCVRRTATLAAGPRICASDFACQHDECLSAVLWRQPPVSPGERFVPLPIARTPLRRAAPEIAEEAPYGFVASTPEDDRDERDRLIGVMEQAGWVQAKAARILGLTPRQVGYALRKHAIPIKKF